MNKEIISRLQQAKEYQKKAIYALFPERMSKHLEVIGNELTNMFMEMAFEMMKQGEGTTKDFSFTESSRKEAESKCKKVNID